MQAKFSFSKQFLADLYVIFFCMPFALSGSQLERIMKFSMYNPCKFNTFCAFLPFFKLLKFNSVKISTNSFRKPLETNQSEITARFLF